MSSFALVVFDWRDAPEASWAALVPTDVLESVPGATLSLLTVHGKCLDAPSDDPVFRAAVTRFEELFFPDGWASPLVHYVRDKSEVRLPPGAVVSMLCFTETKR